VRGAGNVSKSLLLQIARQPTEKKMVVEIAAANPARRIDAG